MKISFKDLKNIKLFDIQGASWSLIYSASYNNQEVIVKTQKSGSFLKSIEISDDRFEQEKKILLLQLENIVKLIAWGDDFNGERFLVLEKLNSIPDNINKSLTQKISDIKKSMEDLSSRVIRSGDELTLITALEELANKNGVVQKIEYSASALKKNTLGINISLEGPYENLLRYLNDFERSRYFLHISNFQLAPVLTNEKVSGSSRMIINAIFYVNS